jgi:multiple sugar transport system permease protein
VTSWRDRRLGIALVAPSVVVLALVSIYPVVNVLALSLERRVPVFQLREFVGLANFRFLLTDSAFWNAVRVTGVFTVTSVVLEIVVGVLLALAIDRLRALRAVGVGLLLLPWCLPGVVTARTFEWLLHPTSGLVNQLLGMPLNWLGDPTLALAAVIGADVWRTAPFVGLLSLARLATIPPSVYEAAAVDGAGPAIAFRRITLPLLAPVLLVTALFRTLDALRAFDVMYVLTGGGPAATTETLTLYAYRNLFQTLQMGFGSAIATAVFIVVVLTAAGYLRAIESIERRR